MQRNHVVFSTIYPFGWANMYVGVTTPLYRNFLFVFWLMRWDYGELFLCQALGNRGLNVRAVLIVGKVLSCRCQIACLPSCGLWSPLSDSAIGRLLAHVLSSPCNDPHANSTCSFNGWVILQQSLTLFNGGLFHDVIHRSLLSVFEGSDFDDCH